MNKRHVNKFATKSLLALAVTLGTVLCMQPVANAASPLLFKGGDNALWAKETLDGPWIKIATNVATFEASGDRILYKDGSNVWMKDGVRGVWYLVSTDGDVTFSDKLIVRKFSGSTLYAKDKINSNWVNLGHSSYWGASVFGNRIIYAPADSNYGVWAKEGIYGSWYHITSHADMYDASDRALIISDYGTLYGKTNLNSNWVAMNPTPVKSHSIRLDGNGRVSYTDTNDHVWAKDGITGAWYDMYVNPDQYGASDSLFIMRLGTTLYGKNALNSPWIAINPTPAADVKVDDNRIIYTTADGHLWAKDGLYGTWWQQY